MISSTQFSEFAESRVRLPENSARNPFENFGILCAKIFRPLDERGSAQKDAMITKTRWPGKPHSSSKNLARCRPCCFPLPSAVGAISPASFEHEYPGKAGLFWVRHEHFFQLKTLLIANFTTHGPSGTCHECSWGARTFGCGLRSDPWGNRSQRSRNWCWKLFSRWRGVACNARRHGKKIAGIL